LKGSEMVEISEDGFNIRRRKVCSEITMYQTLSRVSSMSRLKIVYLGVASRMGFWQRCPQSWARCA
jgi:hypothetical protein